MPTPKRRLLLPTPPTSTSTSTTPSNDPPTNDPPTNDPLDAHAQAKTTILSLLDPVPSVIPCAPGAPFDGLILLLPDALLSASRPTRRKRNAPSSTLTAHKRTLLASLPAATLACIYFSILPLHLTASSVGGYPGFLFPAVPSAAVAGSLVLLVLGAAERVAVVEAEEYRASFEGRWVSAGCEWLWEGVPGCLEGRVVEFGRMAGWVERLREAAMRACEGDESVEGEREEGAGEDACGGS